MNNLRTKPTVYTVMANEILKNRSEVSHGVLKSGCAVYNCINTAIGACVLATALSGASGTAGTVCTISSDFFGISLAMTVQVLFSFDKITARKLSLCCADLRYVGVMLQAPN